MTTTAIINAADTRAQTALNEAQDFIDQLSEIADDQTIGLTTDRLDLVAHIDGLNTGVSLNPFTNVNAPDPAKLLEIDKAKLFALPEPAAIETDTFFERDLPVMWEHEIVPEFVQTAPILDAIAKPTTTLPPAPVAYDADINGITIPVWETKDLPDEVELNELTLAEPSVVEIDPVDLLVPTLDLVVPENNFEFEESTYSSELLAALQALISEDITQGGYGIEPTDEEALYERGREREAKQSTIAVNQVRKGLASRGFPVPPGALFAAESVILQDAGNKLAELNREIVLKRSDLYVQARQFAVQQGIGLEQALLTFEGAKQERALKAAQVTAEMRIQFHNLGVQLFQTKIELRKLYRDLHAEQLKTVTARVQEYERQLAYADMQDKQNRTRLEQYKHRSDAIRLFYDAQKAKDEYTRLEIDLERLKLQASQDRINVYSAQVRNYAEEYNAYRTEWQAQETKQNVFTQQIAAHEQQVKVIAQTDKIKQDNYNDELAQFKIAQERAALRLEHYSVEINKIMSEINLDTQNNQQEIDVWKTNRATEQFNSSNEQTRNVDHARLLLEATRTNIDKARQAVDGVMGLKELNGTAAIAALKLYKAAITGAENAFTGIATYAE